MGKTKFVFDSASGTLKPAPNNQGAVLPSMHEIPDPPSPPKEENEEAILDLRTQKPNVSNESIVQFREGSDHTIVQITDERTRKVMMIIAGYGLEIKFNMAELRSTEKIEQLLGGLTSMFRKMILEQALNKQKG